MPIVTVGPGDCLASLCDANGFGEVATVQDCPQNAGLKESGRTVPTQLVPGDQVFIPEKTQKVVACATGGSHRFTVRRVKVVLDLVLQYEGKPLANAAYTLTVGDDATTGTTGGDGRLTVPVPATATQGHLAVKDPAIEWDLAIGFLEPPTTPNGARARLVNLGYLADDPPTGDGEDGSPPAAALRRFQADAGVAVTGELDTATQDALRSAHDG